MTTVTIIQSQVIVALEGEAAPKTLPIAAVSSAAVVLVAIVMVEVEEREGEVKGETVEAMIAKRSIITEFPSTV